MSTRSTMVELPGNAKRNLSAFTIPPPRPPAKIPRRRAQLRSVKRSSENFPVAVVWPQHSRRYERDSAVFPRRRALLQERADSLGGVAAQHVLHHHLRGEAIGVAEPHVELA